MGMNIQTAPHFCLCKGACADDGEVLHAWNQLSRSHPENGFKAKAAAAGGRYKSIIRKIPKKRRRRRRTGN